MNEKLLQLLGQGANLRPGPQRDTHVTRPHAVESRHGVGAVFALDDGLPVQRVPVVELSVELDGDDVQVARIMVPGEVAVHTDNIHVGRLGGQTQGPRGFYLSVNGQVVPPPSPPTTRWFHPYMLNITVMLPTCQQSPQRHLQAPLSDAQTSI